MEKLTTGESIPFQARQYALDDLIFEFCFVSSRR